MCHTLCVCVCTRLLGRLLKMMGALGGFVTEYRIAERQRRMCVIVHNVLFGILTGRGKVVRQPSTCLPAKEPVAWDAWPSPCDKREHTA